MRRITLLLVAIPFALVLASDGHDAAADSVAQVQTAKRISETTVQLIDPQGGTTTGGGGSNVNYAVGDILTFIIRFTPVENGATRGLGGYITEYVPANTEVVGARIVNAAGDTICPQRGGLGSVGWGPRGDHNFAPGGFPTCPANGCFEGEGSMSSLYADTGIFYSTDSRTARTPNDSFITVTNGLQMPCNPTGADQLDDLLGANIDGPYFAHNEWDNVQLVGFGCDTSTITDDGKGNTPFGYGSAVAGPDSYYPYEATEVMGVVMAAGNVGPWNRVKAPCSEIGTGVAATAEGPNVDRLGVPTALGHALSPDNPLPAGTNAVRFAVGELVVGKEYLAEISLRVLAAPLDPTMNADVNCSEVFGGDSSSRTRDASAGGKDNTWRYFLPAPACVSLDLLFNLDVDKLSAVATDSTITYTIRAKNLNAITTYTNVVITDNLLAGVGNVNFVSASDGGVEAGGIVTWPTISLAPGDEVTYTVVVDGTGGASPILNRASIVTTQLPGGFSVVALTNFGDLAVIDLDLAVAPNATTAGGTVTYTATVSNTGTGPANVGCGDCGVTVTLPAGFTVAPGTTTVNGGAAGEPANGPPNYLFTNGLVNIPAGGSAQITFDAVVGMAVTPGTYRSNLDSWLDDPAQREISDAIASVAPVHVDVTQSDIPVVTDPIGAGTTTVCGTSTEADGTTIHVFVDLIEVGTTTVMGGIWCASIPSVFAGQNIHATAENTGAGEVPSDVSVSVSVTGGGQIVACNDNIDNDSDGLTDFPDDPGCSAASDVDETDVPECSDGIDNDMDGQTDFPDDQSCASYLDDDEAGPPACNDMVDNDMDGQTDFPNDPGCDSMTDVSEADLPQCANGIDDDSDGQVDFPADGGCTSSVDDDEGGGAPVGDAGVSDAGVTVDAGVGGADGAVSTSGDGGFAADPGGVDRPSAGGCCSVGHTPSTGETLGRLLLCGLILVSFRRRRTGSCARPAATSHHRQIKRLAPGLWRDARLAQLDNVHNR